MSADSLAEHLELSPGALRTSVSRLRRVVGFDVLVTAPPGYELRSDDIDARRFEELAGRRPGRRPTPLRRSGARGGARAVARRGLRRVRLRELGDRRGPATHRAAGRCGRRPHRAPRRDAGEWSAAIATIQPLIETEPFRDRPRGLLMRALADSGRRTDALRRVPDLPERSSSTRSGRSRRRPSPSLDREIARDHDQIVTGESLGVFLMTDIVGSTRLWAEHPERDGCRPGRRTTAC